MAEMYLHNHKVNSIFQLLGEHENDISYSVAWALAQCPSFLHEFLQKIGSPPANTNTVQIRLQHHETNGGITDIEIESSGRFYVIVEAKRGWNLPDRRQLEKYVARRSFKKSKAPFKRLVTLTECSREYANLHLPARKIEGVPIESISWKDVAVLASKSRWKASHAQKRLIEELLTYLEGLMTMQKMDSNRVYVVALASGTPKGWGISWIDIVKKRKRYFHPIGIKGWPKEPPNYIAVRYKGKLQSIHHVEGYEVVEDLQKKIPEIKGATRTPRFLYRLGPAFRPNKEIRTGRIYRNGRVWCMLDTLFTCDTISDARDVSNKRERAKHEE
ncbi:MAG: hypothetical protein O7B35_02435 [Deltaproteobacteria bacterium]|nr:hypothetical protein [Deltaproteobacteria bacterium]